MVIGFEREHRDWTRCNRTYLPPVNSRRIYFVLSRVPNYLLLVQFHYVVHRRRWKHAGKLLRVSQLMTIEKRDDRILSGFFDSDFYFVSREWKMV